METLRAVADALRDADGPDDDCGCVPTFEAERLHIDAGDCPGDGRLADSPDCRATVVRELAERDADAVHVRQSGFERVYEDEAAALLVAAGRFCDAAQFRDERLADRAATDPLGAGREAAGRADAVADVAAETGLAELTARATDYGTALVPRSGLAVSDWRVETAPPPDATLADCRDLPTGSAARVYDVPDGRDRYVLTPVGHDLGPAATAVLSDAYDRLASGHVSGGDRAAGRAVRAVVEDDATGSTADDLPVERIARVLHRHTRGHGLLADLFADDRVSDAFVTAPATERPLSVCVGDRRVPTNVRLTERGLRSLAARYRRESGRGFSRAEPTLDAATEIRGRRVRVAGVTDPASDGVAFAFRAHDREVWTLPALVANGTVSASAAALLSVAVERGRALLVAGPRGAGKTTMLGALLWELRPDVRALVIEDAPELPVDPLQSAGRNVQALRAAAEDDFAPADALRTALRLGDGAIAVGEVRGEEAQVLYEAMRVGASDEAVLGTIHGDGADDVLERVVEDLGVPASSFGVTDLVVSLERTADGTRRVRTIEEVDGGDGNRFDALYEHGSDGLAATGRVDRGNSRLVDALARPGESYAGVRETVEARADRLSTMARTGRTDADSVTDAVRERQP